MNSAHYHLIVNHFPIIGLLIGAIVLLTGFLSKKSDINLTGFGILIFSAIASIFAFYTGEGAEEIVEHLPEMSKTLIHTHEEYAEKFFILTLVIGVFSISGFILEWRKNILSRYVKILVLLMAFVNVFFAKNVGTSGGEIRHSEIRINSPVILMNPADD